MNRRPASIEWDYHNHAIPKKEWQSWLSSIVFHLLVFLAVAFLLYQAPRGVGEEQVATGGIVLVNADLDANEKPYLEQADVESPDAAEDAAAALMGGEVATSNPTFDLDQLPELPGLPSSEDARRKALEAQQQGSGLADLAVPTQQSGGGKIGQKPVLFGGAVGTGSRFVYVVDRSGSMNSGGLMDAAKAELEASLNSLTELQQFQVIFYNDNALIFNPSGGAPKMHYGTKENVAAALEFIRQTPATGGTVHMAALEPALRLGADVIFFLTDADDALTPDEFNRIGRLNTSNASINVIVFGPTPEPTAVNLTFTRLTRETRGQFVFKSTSALRRSR